MPRFRQLQALHAVIETGTVTGAGDRLGISQPGISNLLSQLESETKLSLFKRSKGRLLPTPEAMVLFQEVETLVRSLNQVDQTVVDLQNQRVGHLQVVVTHALSHGFLPKLISEFVAPQPEIVVSFNARYSKKIQEWILSSLYEVGVSELPIDQNRLQYEIMQFECQCVVPFDSPLACLNAITPSDLDNTPFVALGPDHMTYRRIVEAFIQADSRLRVRCHVHLFRTALDFVKEGMGVAIIDPFTLAHDDGNGYVCRPMKPAIHLDLAIIHSKERPLSRLASDFNSVLRREMSAFATGGLRRNEQ